MNALIQLTAVKFTYHLCFFHGAKTFRDGGQNAKTQESSLCKMSNDISLTGCKEIESFENDATCFLKDFSLAWVHIL
jgi:hypothetical protein